MSISPVKLGASLLLMHVVFSLFINLFPSSVGSSSYINIYRRYLLPGPFFSEKTIDQTHLLYLSWKGNGKWQSPINPTLNHFHHFFSTWNPSVLYRTRLERSIYENWLMAQESKYAGQLDFDGTAIVKYYAKNGDIANDYDSVRMTILKQIARDLDITRDTLQILEF